jgi:transglutaminase-like putative cysteine protease
MRKHDKSKLFILIEQVMAVELISNMIKDYLKSSKYIDWGDSDIWELANFFSEKSQDEIDFVKGIYHYVRDEIKHSWDIQDKRVTAKASQVLHEKVGICWAKSNLLAALLRSKGIPTGICYQRLTLGDTPDTGYCIHAFNAVYLKTLNKWIRIDARGNKEGINAEFLIKKEQLAFTVRPEYDEIDYEEIYDEPIPITMQILEKSTDALYMYLHSLPERL